MLCTLSRLASAILIAGLLAGSLAAQEPHFFHHHGNGEFVCRDMNDGNPDLFYNFYIGDGCDRVPAQMYISPQPVPPLVGHTYITYQPLMPHEFMYHHHHTYYRYYDGGRGMTRAAVHYYCPPVRQGLANVAHHFKIPR